ncbi:hypothetical protein [Streptomyces sp. H27-D2]|uniref:hypothetical protein n=1 Tax=Streptomyces sp. H27-D2 TaxID=3046304 RepID=UPI002DBB8A33|nr:hypothetical protein [Streptomyces sp. H27-D2]MEC4016105.1 hypothetical protein [Streptomyces sp. H27-D2]
MVEYSAPFSDSQIATEYQWSRIFRNPGLDGVISDDPSSSALKVTGSGVSTVTVGAGEAYVNGFFYRLDETLTVPVTSNSAGSSARIDLVVLRADQSGNIVSAKYKAGGTSAPTLATDEAGVYELPLAQTTVAAGASAVTAGNVTDKRWFSGKPAAVGNPASRRPSRKGMLLVENKDVYLGNGTGWDLLATAGSTAYDSYTPIWTAGATTINWGSGSKNYGRYKLLGKKCDLTIQIIPTGNPPAYDDPIQVTLPFPCTSLVRSLFTWNFTSANDEGAAFGVGMTFPTDSTSKIARLRFSTASGNTSAAIPNAFNLLTNQPFNIRPDDVLTITGTYEIA